VEQLSHMTADTIDEAEDEILSQTVSDETLEAAAGTGWPAIGANSAAQTACNSDALTYVGNCFCCG
jgi:hypothetical protein